MNMQIDHTSPVPLHKQIEVLIRSLVESGDYDGGKLLPREEELARKFGVSRNTVRQGIYKLVLEGLLVRKKGVGTMVAPRTITTHLDEWHSFTEEMSRRGIKVRNYLVDIQSEAAPQGVSELFQVQKNAELFKLERLRGDENGPFVYFISWFHPRVPLSGTEDFTRPLYKLFEEKFSIFPTSSHEELKAVKASEKVAAYLGIEENTPVLFRKRTVFDTGNRIIEYNLGYYRSDKFAYSINIRRNS
ncbi:GntR family transcriptional regulator [Anseongella ginsenosidimutans]|nr:GntR family transcriptional regulator [Anseongella ginsenosidimutans]